MAQPLAGIPDLAETAVSKIRVQFHPRHTIIDITLRIDTSRRLLDMLRREELDLVAGSAVDDVLNQGTLGETPMIWIAREAKTLAMHPGKSIPTPAEIAKAAVFMISDACPFMNAARLVVEGSSVCRKFGLRSEIGRSGAGAMPGSP